MAADDDPGLYFIDPSDWPGAEEHRAELARHRCESRRRYADHLAAVLIGSAGVADAVERATIVLDALTVRRYGGAERPCACSCHPRLPESDFHDYGFGCPCTQSSEERARGWEAWRAAMEEYWASPEGRAVAAAEVAREAELDAWLEDHPEVVVTSHGGLAPEQWEGSVDGRSFYFRERHDQWRIELDLRPTGRFVKRWKGGELDDDSFDLVEVTEGDVIADGTVRARGYGETAVERIEFIVGTVRAHLASEACHFHAGPVHADLVALLGESLRWCPSCGARVKPSR